jgi:CubicO group peptidase (beta-lactamase class C family)
VAVRVRPSARPMTGSSPAPVLMSGAPPFPADSAVTLANWQDPPFNRWAFQHVRELIPSARIARRPRYSGPLGQLPRNEQDLGRIAFSFDDRELTVAEMLASTWTDGFLVLHRGRVVTEQYFNGMAQDTPHLLMSVSKSVTSAVAGALAGRGVLDVGAEVTRIVPELASTSFAGATVQHLLDMRAGTRFNEDYDDLEADVRKYERVYLWRPPSGADESSGPAVDDALGYFATLENDGPHGGPFRYRSILTDVLAWVIERAAGQRLHELISRELWQPMGAEFDAEITVDGRGNPMADGGISATLRDIARFGQLYLRRGRAGRQQVVPTWWVDDTVRGAPDGARAFSDGDDSPGYPAGSHYRNCWWVPDPALPFFYASGINGQGVFVHVPSETVIAKFSTWPVAWSDELYGQTEAGILSIAEALAAGRV